MFLMKKCCSVLWLKITGFFMLFCASVLTSKLLTASNCTAEKVHLWKHSNGKTWRSLASLLPLCRGASLQQACGQCTTSCSPQRYLCMLWDLLPGLELQGYFKYKSRRNKEHYKAPYTRPKMRKFIFL